MVKPDGENRLMMWPVRAPTTHSPIPAIMRKETSPPSPHLLLLPNPHLTALFEELQDLAMHNNRNFGTKIFFRKLDPDSETAYCSMAFLASWITVRIAAPKERLPNEGPSACLMDRKVDPLVPPGLFGGAKYLDQKTAQSTTKNWSLRIKQQKKSTVAFTMICVSLLYTILSNL